MNDHYQQAELDFDKEFAGKTWAFETVKTLKNFMRRQFEKIEKAYGGCRECYGKGYSTVTGTDSTGERLVYSKVKLNFCVCDRGQQLHRLLAE